MTNKRTQRPMRTKKTQRKTAQPHLVSKQITSITLKTTHKREEIYPIALSELVSRANVGSDADVYVKGYKLTLTLATGNKTETVSMNLGHSGPWVRRDTAGTDTFNQQFSTDRLAKTTRIHFSKQVASAERQFLNPDQQDNFINLRVRDVAGICKGITIRIDATFDLVRKVLSTAFPNADMPATDRYVDQDVNGTAVVPPSTTADIPRVIRARDGLQRGDLVTADTASPYKYGTGNFSMTVTQTGVVNKVGQFNADLGDSAQTIQSTYTAAGYAGTIAKRSNRADEVYTQAEIDEDFESLYADDLYDPIPMSGAELENARDDRVRVLLGPADWSKIKSLPDNRVQDLYDILSELDQVD